MLKFRVATSDLSIIRGCKSLLCQPAVKGANMPWPLHLEESLCRSAIGSSLHGVTEVQNTVTTPDKIKELHTHFLQLRQTGQMELN